MLKSTALLFALTAGLWVAPPAAAGTPTELFLKFPGGGPFGPPMLEPPGIAAIVEYQVVPNVAGLLADPDELLIDLPAQPAFTVARTRFSAYPSPPTEPPKAGETTMGTGSTTYTWSGYDGETEVVLTFTEDRVSGLVNLGQHRYVIDYRETEGPGDPGQLLTQLDHTAFPGCALGTAPPKRNFAQPRATAVPATRPARIDTESRTDAIRTGFGPTVDVLVLYTPAALARVGSVNAMTTRVANSNDQLNEAITRSDIPNRRVRVVGVEQIAFNENNGVTPHSTRWYGYRTFVRNSAFAQTRRNVYQADLVTMFVHDNLAAYCGIAYVQRPDCGLDSPTPEPGCAVGAAYDPFAYSVVEVDCAHTEVSYAHEVGHQIGAEHQPDYAYDGIGSFVWSYGHSVSQVARTVMAYRDDCLFGNCPRQLQFSNPFVNFFGGSGPPTGSLAPESPFDPRYRYNAKTILYLAQGTANFRLPTAPADTIFANGFQPK